MATAPKPIFAPAPAAPPRDKFVEPAPPPPRPFIDWAIEILLIGLVAYLAFAFGGVWANHQMVGYTIGGVIALLLAIRAIIHPPTFARAWIWIPPVLFVFIAALQLIPFPTGVIESISPQTAEMKRDLLDDLPNAQAVLSRMAISFYSVAGRDDLRLVLLAMTVLWGVTTVFRDARSIHRVLWALTLLGGAMGLLALLQDISHTDKIYWQYPISEPARSGTFANHSHYSQFMNLSIGAALAMLLVHLTRPRDYDRPPLRTVIDIVLPAAVIVIGLATISLSLSRGGMVAIAGAGVFTIIVLLAKESTRWLGGVVAFLGVITVIALAIYGIERVEGRLRERGGIDVRFQMVRDSWGISKQFPVTGIGLGTFEWVYTMYDRTGTPSIASHVENEYVQALVEMGWIGLLLVISMIAIIAYHWLRAMGSPDRLIAAAAAAGLGYGLVAVMIHSLSDFGQHLPANAVLSAMICGLIIDVGLLARNETRTVTKANRIAGVVIALMVVAAAVWALLEARRTKVADAHWRKAQPIVRQLERKDWEGTRQQYDRLIAPAQAAIDAQPESAYYRYWTALYRWRQSRRTRDDNDPMLLPEAKQVVAELHEARRLCPTYGPIYSVLGQIEYTALNLSIGLTHIRTAARLEPNDPNILFIVGRSDARRGKFDEAKEMFRRAITLDGSVINDVIDLYLDELERPELAIDVASDHDYRMFQVSAALDQEPKYKELARKAYVMGVELLEKKVQGPDARSYDLGELANRLASLQRDAEADKYYVRALEKDYTSLFLRTQRALCLHRLGRITEAIEEAQRAARQHPESPDAKVVLELVSKPIAPR